MIKVIEKMEELNFIGDTPFGCKISSLANAYGINGHSVMFWAQDNDKSAIAKIDDIVLIENIDADFDELANFIRMLNPKILSCSADTALKLGFHTCLNGEIMLLSRHTDLVQNSKAVINPGLREIYGILDSCRSQNFLPPEFEPFYMDMSHRTRHGAAMSAGIMNNGHLVSCALCSAANKNTAVISAVACLPQFRLSGFGTAAVSVLIANLKRYNIYIFRHNGINEKFYRTIGFKKYGCWAEIKFCDVKQLIT
jgi:GNAT superfamily N-acetyltransferase